jgi:hypothetical protein
MGASWERPKNKPGKAPTQGEKNAEKHGTDELSGDKTTNEGLRGGLVSVVRFAIALP